MRRFRIYAVVNTLQIRSLSRAAKWQVLLSYMDDVNSGRVSHAEFPLWSPKDGHA